MCFNRAAGAKLFYSIEFYSMGLNRAVVANVRTSAI